MKIYTTVILEVTIAFDDNRIDDHGALTELLEAMPERLSRATVLHDVRIVAGGVDSEGVPIIGRPTLAGKRLLRRAVGGMPNKT